MNEKATFLEISEVETLLTDFLWLKHPPKPLLPQKDPELLQLAIDKAWKSERKFCERNDSALSMNGIPGQKLFYVENFEKRNKLRRLTEKKLGHPVQGGLSSRFRNKPEENYCMLDSAYLRAKSIARREIWKETKKVKEKIDLLLTSIKAPLLNWSELANTRGKSKAWEIYQTAINQSQPKFLDTVIQDLQRIKSKLHRDSRITATVQTQQPATPAAGQIQTIGLKSEAIKTSRGSDKGESLPPNKNDANPQKRGVWKTTFVAIIAEEMKKIQRLSNYRPKFSTPSELAKELGISKSTLSKAIGKNGNDEHLKKMWCTFQAEIIAPTRKGYRTKNDQEQMDVEAISD